LTRAPWDIVDLRAFPNLFSSFHYPPVEVSTFVGMILVGET
jgi:hypothetical protein